MKYEIIIEIDDEIHIVKVLNHFDEIAPTILRLMHKNPGFIYQWRKCDGIQNEISSR